MQTQQVYGRPAVLKYLALALVLSVSFVPRAHAVLECSPVNEYTQLYRCADDAKGTFTVDGWKHSPNAIAMVGDASHDHSARLYLCLGGLQPTQIDITVTYTLGGRSKTDTAFFVCTAPLR
jgi:hypothetical protein